MTLTTLGLLVLAGVGAGLVGTVAGLASLVSYPALIAAGLSPVAANVTNTVALVGNAVGGISGSRPELAGRGPQVRRLALPAVLGGITGGLLLLATPSDDVEKIVPWLIALGSLAVLLRPRPAVLATEGRVLDGGADPAGREAHSRALWWGVFAISVYGGYFGAAAGVLMLALFLLLTGDTVATGSALRTTVLALANGVAALSFAVLGPVHWAAALAMGLGFSLGSRWGPVVLRHSPDRLLRVVIAVAGMGLAVHLAQGAY